MYLASLNVILIQLEAAVYKGKPKETPGRKTDDWVQGEVSPTGALARWGKAGDAPWCRSTMASAWDTGEPGASSPALSSHQCCWPFWWQGRGRARARESISTQSTGCARGLARVHPTFTDTQPHLSHGPAARASAVGIRPWWSVCFCLPGQHPSRALINAKQRIYFWMAITEYHSLRYGLTAFVWLDLLQHLGHNKGLSAVSTKVDAGRWSQCILLPPQCCPVPSFAYAQL